jgi:prepilin-type processing-associated H-X9-DG protein
MLEGWWVTPAVWGIPTEQTMSRCDLSVRSVLVSILSCMAGLAGVFPGSALAQDCKLSVQATPHVLYAGESATVDVLAHFPSAPVLNAPYAFASAAFDVHASDPLWSLASAGAIVGSDVLGIAAGQPHSPQTGVFADPANPYRVWRGVFTPDSDGPALVEVAADPTSFSVYPSKRTSSWAPREAEGGSDFILVNPLNVGSWLAAPGNGTEIHVSDDVIVDGRIITGENPQALLIGLLLPAVQSGKTYETRVAFDEQPVTFTTTVQVENAQRTRVGSMNLSFDGQATGNAGGYVAGANFAFGDGSVRFVRYQAFSGGVFVASGDLDASDGVNGKIPGLVVDSVPDSIGARVGPGRLILAAQNGYSVAEWSLRYDQPVNAVVRGTFGRPRPVKIDFVVVHGVIETGRRLQSSNNLKQLGLGCHNFEASGVESMSITPAQPE